MTAPLTEQEIRDLIDGPGSIAEKLVVYGWDRICATLVLANVLRKRLVPFFASERTAKDAGYSDLRSDGGMDPRDRPAPSEGHDPLTCHLEPCDECGPMPSEGQCPACAHGRFASHDPSWPGCPGTGRAKGGAR